MIDIHTHILPHMDDGANDEEVCMQMLEDAYEQGIRGIIATPHYHVGYFAEEKETIQMQYNEIREAANKRWPDLSLYIGNEIYYNFNISERLGTGKLFTLGKSHYVLVEFAPGQDFFSMKRCIQELTAYGYFPVFAHPERYEELGKNLERIRECIRLGACMQINAGSVLGHFGRGYRRVCKKMLKSGLVHFIASDMHNMDSRRENLAECLQYLSRKYSEEYVNTIMYKNPEKLLLDEGIG